MSGPMVGSTNWPEDKKEILKTLGNESDKKEVEEIEERIKEAQNDSIKVEFTFTSPDKQENEDRALRLIKADQAFNALWDLDQKLRSLLKYKYGNEENWSADEIIKDLEDTRDIIHDSALLEFYT